MHILCQDLWNLLAFFFSINFKEQLRLNDMSFWRVNSFVKACIPHRTILRHLDSKDAYKMSSPVIILS